LWGTAALPTAPTLGSVAGELTLLAGNVGGNGNCDGWGPYARFNGPNGLAIDSADNLYVADTSNLVVRKVTPGAAVSTFAGLANTSGTDDGARTAARFAQPLDAAATSDGTLYVADNNSHTIRRVTRDGVVSTFAGSAGASGFVNGSGAAARFNRPVSVAVDGAGNVYVADTGNFALRKITPAGEVSTLAGGAFADPPADGTGGAASFGRYYGLAAAADGTVWVADQTTIRRVSAGGVVTTIAGVRDVRGSSDGTGAAARFESIVGLALAPNGDLVVADQGAHTIRRVTPAGVVTTIAGRSGVQGSADGAALQATFKQPADVAVDRAGNVFVIDYGNFTVRRLSTAGVVSTFAGSPKVLGSVDGTGTAAQFFFPNALARDAAGNVYAAESGNNVVRRIAPDGSTSTLAGTAPLSGSTDGTGAAARFRSPQGIAVDGAGNLFVADTENSVIRRVTPQGVVTTFAGATGVTGSADGSLANARFDRPRGIAIDAQGDLYVSDTRNRTVRKIFVASGQVVTLAGTAGVSGSADGVGAEAQFGGGGANIYHGPEHVTVDQAGNVYVADIASLTIRKITPGGVVTTLAGSAGQSGTADGTGAAARFRAPRGLAVDDAGSLYVTDFERVRRIDTATGAVTTVVGRVGSIGFLLGPLPATLGAAFAVAVVNRNQIVIASDSALYLATFR
jgi:sugar lactone lactonase YvrE